MTPRPPRLRAFVAALFLAAATFLTYLPVGENDFVDYDDGAYVTKNHDVSAGLTSEGVRWAFTSSHSANWHPLTWLSHMLDCELFGLEPRGHHLMSAGLHALNAALCLLALFALTGSLVPSIVVAALFALHPQRVESVAWVAERKDVLSGTFFFLTLMAYARYARQRSRLAYAAVALALTLGLMAKQMLVTLPFLLLVLDGWPLKRWEKGAAKRLILEKVPLIALAVGAGIVTLFAQSADSAIRSLDSLPLETRVSNAFVAYGAYLEKMLWPTNLAVFYPHPGLLAPDTFSVFGARAVISTIALALVTFILIRVRRTQPWLLTGFLWYVGTLLPVIGIVQVGGQWMADRYAYLTLIGVYVSVAFGTYHLLTNKRARAAFAIAGLALAAALVPATRQQIGVWKGTRTLFDHALDVTDANYVAHINLGFLEHNQGSLKAAEKHYLAAIEIAPNMADTHSNLGGIHFARGDFAEAEFRLEHALKIDPGFVKARMLLGLVFEEIGEPDAALLQYERAVHDDPSSVEAAAKLGDALVMRGAAEQAVTQLNKSLARHPNSEELMVALGKALAKTGDAAGALRTLERATQRPSVSTPTVEALCWLLATSKDERVRNCDRALDLALELARRVGDGEWTTSRVRAAAHACAGQWDSARRLALDAWADAPENEQRSLKELHGQFRSQKAVFE